MPKSEKIQKPSISKKLPHPLGPHYEENNETVAFSSLCFKYHNQDNFKQLKQCLSTPEELATLT